MTKDYLHFMAVCTSFYKLLKNEDRLPNLSLHTLFKALNPVPIDIYDIKQVSTCMRHSRMYFASLTGKNKQIVEMVSIKAALEVYDLCFYTIDETLYWCIDCCKCITNGENSLKKNATHAEILAFLLQSLTIVDQASSLLDDLICLVKHSHENNVSFLQFWLNNKYGCSFSLESKFEKTYINSVLYFFKKYLKNKVK